MAFDAPGDQWGVYLVTLTSIGIVTKGLWQSWSIKMAAEIHNKVGDPGRYFFHRFFSGLDKEHMVIAERIRRFVHRKTFAFAGLLMGSYIGIVQFKNQGCLTRQ